MADRPLQFEFSREIELRQPRNIIFDVQKEAG
jgi:hypothetical protein